MSRWSKMFMTDGYCDQNLVAAESIVLILEAPGMVMLEAGVTEEDLEAHDPAVRKFREWLAGDDL